MSRPQIFIADTNPDRIQSIRDATFRANIAPPISRDSAQAAILWTSLNPCDLLVISYELPDMNGLDALVRIRNRQPGLSAIMIAETDSQAVAISAFRTGVIDFIPAGDDVGNLVADVALRLEEQALAVAAWEDSIRLDPTLAEIPADRLELTYQNRLRTIGRQLDVYQYRSIMVLEVDGGFLARGVAPGSRRPQALEFPDRELPRLVQISVDRHEEKRATSEVVSPVVPTGYEDLLRAIGYKLDQTGAESVSICQFEDAIIVGGRWRGEDRLNPSIEPFWMCLQEVEVEALLNQAFNRRGKSKSGERASNGSRRDGLRALFQRFS